MFTWIIEALQGITETHALVAMLPLFLIGMADDETPEAAVERLTTELAAAKEVGSKGFYGGLSAEVQSNPSMMKFKGKSAEDVAKSYIDLQSKISAKGLTIPNKNASKEEMAEFYKALGRPDTMDGYQLSVAQDLHKSIVSNAESQKVFKEQCYKLGLNSEQTQGLHSWYMGELSNTMKQMDEADEKASNEATTALRARWGTTYDAKLALATKVVNKFGGEKAQEFLDKGLGNDPVIIEMFANIGDKLSEDALGPGGKSQYGGLTPDAAEAKKKEILHNPKHPYHISGPGHKEAVEEMLELNKLLAAAEKTE